MRAFIQAGLALTLLLGGGLVFAMLLLTRPEASQRPLEEREWVVDTIAVEKGALQPTLRLTGRIVAARDAELRPLAVGRIVEIGDNFIAGGQVSKGDLLVQIDPFEYEAEAADAEAAVKEANASLAEVQADLKANKALIAYDREQETLRQRDMTRRRNLQKRGAVSTKSMDDARIAYLAARQARITRTQTIERLNAQAIRLEATASRAEVRLKRAQRSLAETRLTAPFDGVLVDVSATIGKRVSANDRIARIVDSRRLEALFHMSDAQFGRLAAAGGVKGRPATVVWRAGANSVRLKAMLERVEGEFDAASGGVWVYAPIMPDQNVIGLRPGAFVEAETPDVRYDGVARLPQSAVHGENRVYVLREGRLAERQVTVLGREQGTFIVSGDIATGEAAVTTRVPEIGPGLKARARGAAE